MALPWLIPLLVSLGLGMIGGGVDAFQRSRAERARADAATRRRTEIDEFINEYVMGGQAAAQRGLEGQAGNIITRARGTIGAGLGSAVTGSGFQEGRYQDALTEILAALAQDIAADQRERTRIAGSIRQDPAFQVADVPGSTLGDTLLGIIGGGVAGGGSGLANLDWASLFAPVGGLARGGGGPAGLGGPAGVGGLGLRPQGNVDWLSRGLQPGRIA